MIAKYQPENTDKKVVGFEFIEDELLLVMYENGKYYLYDPNGTETVSGHALSFYQDESDNFTVLDCKVFENGFGILV